MRGFRFLLFILLTGTGWRLAAGQSDVPAPTAAGTQSDASAEAPGAAEMVRHPNGVTTAYVQPTRQQKLHNYLFETYGPYPVMWTTMVAGWHQARRSPPDWREGWAGFGQRYASDFGNSVVNITTRYALARVFDEDTLYYRCTCKGVGPRLKHAVIASLFVHQGADGHRAFALPVIAAPYAANMVADYGWFPSRYGAKDAFRSGNYGLLSYFIGNISLEFLSPVLHAKRSSWMTKFHLDNRHLAPETEQAP
ncbi:MAG TPA: hypothetical protein VGG26_06750 [Terracidiphilus sp.]